MTERSKEHALTMEILPREYYDNIQGVLEWYRERACVRMGNWLGTRFPFDQRWIIEAIADSTLYPIYYVISKYANDGTIKPEGMTEEFFDYILLGRGNPKSVSETTGFPVEVIDKIRSDFEYWYPLDINLGGKEHMTVHFPVFLMNHVAVLRPQHWPRGIIVNWYITATGGKISKSKGGARPIPETAERFGVDAMRLFYAHIASLYVDVAWEDDKVDAYRDRLERLWNLVQELKSYSRGVRGEIDAWMEARLENRLLRVHEHMKDFDTRSYANEVFFEVPQDIRWYLRRGGRDGATIAKILDTWVPLMAPITPHTAEEMWASLGKKPFVSTEQIMEPRPSAAAALEEVKERLVQRLLEDISEILKVTEIKPRKIVVMTAPKWKHDMLADALSVGEPKIDVSGLIKATLTKAPAEAKKEIPAYAKDIATEISKASEEGKKAMSLRFDELATLSRARQFLSGEFGCEVESYSADDPNRTDPKGKARFARPGRPAVYVE